MHIKTLKGNDYYIASAVPQILLMHPVSVYLLTLAEQGLDLEKWINQQDENPMEIETGLKATKEELNYYYRYLLFLEENRYFAEAKKYGLSSSRYDADSVKANLANTNQIVYGATHFCSLRCVYCGFGEFYNDGDSRGKKNIEPNDAKILFDYMAELFESDLCRKRHKKVTISFYGGEPLLVKILHGT